MHAIDTHSHFHQSLQRGFRDSLAVPSTRRPAKQRLRLAPCALPFLALAEVR